MIEYKRVNSQGGTSIGRSISQSELTSECWLVQFVGLTECETCDVKNTNECGGPDIRETGKNSKGFEVPLGEPV